MYLSICFGSVSASQTSCGVASMSISAVAMRPVMRLPPSGVACGVSDTRRPSVQTPLSAGDPEAGADGAAGLVERGPVVVEQERGVAHQEERIELEGELRGILAGVQLAALLCPRHRSPRSSSQPFE